MAILKTDYKDDVLDTSKNIRRKFNMIQNSDGTVSFEDVTKYIQQGDSFGAYELNEMTTEINKKGLNKFGESEKLPCKVNNIVGSDGIVTIEGLITGAQYSSVWLNVNNVRVFNIQQEEANGKTQRIMYSFRVQYGDIVSGNATSAANLTFRPLVY